MKYIEYNLFKLYYVFFFKNNLFVIFIHTHMKDLN